MELIDLVNFVKSKMILLRSQMVNFPTRITTCDPHSPALLDLFIFSNTSICSTMDFRALGIQMLLSQFPLRIPFSYAAANEFCEWAQVGIDVYIPHCKY